MAKNVLTYDLAQPLKGMTSAEIIIDPGDGNLTVDGATRDEQELVFGKLEYLEKNGEPIWSVISSDNLPACSIKAARKGQPWLHLPWAACNGATTWQLHLNRRIPTSVIAHSDGGNIKLDLSGMPVAHVSAETGGGNVEVILPEPAALLKVEAKSGAGNVTVQIPRDVAARIQASTGLGKLIMTNRFYKIDNGSYQSPDYDEAEKRIEMVISSGAGNVVIEER